MRNPDQAHEPREVAHDIVSKRKRSEMMRAVRREATPAELVVRGMVRESGASYRTNNRRLPGSPDLSNQRHRWAIFVHGCFWHGHRNCSKTKGGASGRIPRTRSEFWRAKLEGNRRRDEANLFNLESLGLRILVIWECELRTPARVRSRIRRFLEPPKRIQTTGLNTKSLHHR